MATYLQGVTDFIPDYQPFQPDLNFYANVLQTKQTQYDNNWKQLNNLYGQLYGADLTNDLNVQKKDQLLKQIDLFLLYSFLFELIPYAFLLAMIFVFVYRWLDP